MSFNNRNNLPNPSAPWGREVEQRLENLERQTSQNSLDATNGLKNVTSALATLQTALVSLSGQQAELSSIVTRQLETISTFTQVYTTNNGRKNLTFSKPSWATAATVIISGAMIGSLSNYDTKTKVWFISRASVSAYWPEEEAKTFVLETAGAPSYLFGVVSAPATVSLGANDSLVINTLSQHVNPTDFLITYTVIWS